MSKQDKNPTSAPLAVLVVEGATIKEAYEANPTVKAYGPLTVVSLPSTKTRLNTRQRLLREAAAQAKPGTTIGIVLPWVQREDGSGSWTRMHGFLPGGTPLPVVKAEAKPEATEG